MFFNYTVCYLGAKVALVIGNNEYEHLPSLETTTSVVLVATKLIKMGFKVLLYLNITAEEMGNAATTFRKICKEAQTALFFFSGHGGGLDGKTVLAAIDFEHDGEMRPPASMYLDAMAQAERKIVLLNCCREE